MTVVTEAETDRLARVFRAAWAKADSESREGERVTDGLRAVFAEIGVAVAAREPRPGSIVRDRDGDLWERLGDRWVGRTIGDLDAPWADLSRRYGPVTIFREEAASA